MKKKSFRDNPALTFISSSRSQEKEEKQQPAATPTTTAAPVPPAITPQGFRLVPEAKSRRVQLLLQPSLHEAAKKTAEEEGLSFNEFIAQAIKERLGTL